ncbi:MAG: dihydroorotase [Oscillospiraceae bacterium]|jgi:dihydroorotase|nr:dihydroorotase [Oscillospiraceae bacterium]
MKRLLRGGQALHGSVWKAADIAIAQGAMRIARPGSFLEEPFDETIDCGGLFIFPGFKDLHVHFREPGFSSKETIASGSRAAARGGYTAVCTMPNLEPPPDSLPHLQAQLDLIARDAVIPVIPVGAITKGQCGAGALSAMEELAPFVCGFSDDGVGVQDGALMRRAMECAKALDKPIISHCEDKSLLGGGYIHDGTYAQAHKHRGICAESEWIPLARDLELARQTGCAYHVCHVSTKESVALIRRAKARGVRVTAETAPHYLLLTDEDLQEDGRFKMNPPLRGSEDRAALLEGVLDGTIDCIATDHAPHTAQEKAGGLAGSAFGIVGLETAFPLLYTKLVLPGKLPLIRLIDLMSLRPGAVLAGWMRQPMEVSCCAWDLRAHDQIDPANFLSKGKATPFAGWAVAGRCRFVLSEKGEVLWN